MTLDPEIFGYNCPECMEDVDICTGCGDIIHYDDPKALTGGGTYCGSCHKKKFRKGCTNRKMTDTVEGYPV